MIHSLRRLRHPIYRKVHLAMLPPWSAALPWVVVALVLATIAVDLHERSELLRLTDEMRSAISIANRMKNCLEGRRTLGSIFDERGNPAHILCDIKFTKEAP